MTPHVISELYYNIVQCMDENLLIQPPVSFVIYKTFARIEYTKYQQFYSDLEWNILVFRISRIHLYYTEHKEVIYKGKYLKHFAFKVQSQSYFD